MSQVKLINIGGLYGRKKTQENVNIPWLNEVREEFIKLVPNINEGEIPITIRNCHDAIRRKNNWSSPGPDQICNYWWKRLESLLPTIQMCFRQLINDDVPFTYWFCNGRTTLIPKPGELSETNQRPITCTNIVYKWLTSLILKSLTDHLYQSQLMQADQRGAKAKCSGTVYNLLIDDMVLRDDRTNRRNRSCAWIDVRKAFDSVSHSWIKEMLIVHRALLE